MLGGVMALGVGIAVGVKAATNKEAVQVNAAETSFDFSKGNFSNNTITWSDDHLTIFQKNVSGNSNPNSNYISNPRWYAGHKVTFTPASGESVDSVKITCTSASYATALNNGTWTNASHSVSSAVVTITPIDGTAEFTVTLSSQSRISALSYEYSAQSTATLSSIALSGSMARTDYTTADQWDPAGLVVTGTYSDSTTKDLTAGSTFTYYNSTDTEVATPKALGVGDGQTLKVVASYEGVSDTAKYVASTSINVTKATEYELVTDVSKLTKGTKFILVGTDSYSGATYTRAMTQSRTTANSASSVTTVELSDSFNNGSVATSASATIFTLGGSAGAWTIKNGDNQLGFTGTDNNNMQFNENQTDTFKITSYSGALLSIESNTQSGRKLQYNVNRGNPRFSNYSGNQTYLYMFADIAEVSYGTTDHISITGLPETEFAVGDTFSSEGIAITAWDGADEETTNPKTVGTYTTSFDGVTFTDSDIGSKTVTVTYEEDGSSFTDTYDIYVYAAATYELVTEEPTDGWAGSYLITYTVSGSTSEKITDGTYAMKSSLDNYDIVGNYSSVTPITADGVTTITAGQHLQFSIAAYSTGYSIQGQSGKFIGWNNSEKNGLTTSDTALINTLSISGEDVTILCSAGTKGLTLNTTSGQFRYYSNATVQLYKLVESNAASDYADKFLDLLSTGDNPVCNVDEAGNVLTNLDDLKAAWAILASDFNALSNADKEIFIQGTADETGENINRALALYAHIAAAYGTRLESEDCENFNFMNRTIVPLSNSVLPCIGDFSEDGSMISIIAVASLVSVVAIGGYFFLKKKKA